MAAEGNLYLGFDFSTQQIKAVIIDDALKGIAEEHVNFDQDLKEYRTSHGFHEGENGKVTAPTIMWVKALDLIMERIRIQGVDLSRVAALSGAGQQHGSVYWRTGANAMLKQMRPDKFMHDELAHAFSILDSPIWMDSSTSKQCQDLEEALQGPTNLAKITGSRAYERFTGLQIAKIAQEKSEAYSNTERISLVSSFAASLFLGQIAPIDTSDAGGMNLLDINQLQWSQDCLQACAPDLTQLLGAPTSPTSLLGSISNYMIERFGFDGKCQVTAFTGDNPASLAGIRLCPGEICLSLGTSDTVMAYMPIGSEIEPQLVGHIWPNPVESRAFMALLCYKNGSVTREKIRDAVAEGQWDLFNQLLNSTPRGNFGNIGMYYDYPEITPHNLHGNYRFNKDNEKVVKFASNEVEARALIEGQFMAKRLHIEKMGFKIQPTTRIVVTGGASVNDSIIQVLADVFNAPVFTQVLFLINSSTVSLKKKKKIFLLIRKKHKILLRWVQLSGPGMFRKVAKTS